MGSRSASYRVKACQLWGHGLPVAESRSASYGVMVCQLQGHGLPVMGSWSAGYRVMVCQLWGHARTCDCQLATCTGNIPQACSCWCYHLEGGGMHWWKRTASSLHGCNNVLQGTDMRNGNPCISKLSTFLAKWSLWFAVVCMLPCWMFRFSRPAGFAHHAAAQPHEWPSPRHFWFHTGQILKSSGGCKVQEPLTPKLGSGKCIGPRLEVPLN